MLSQNFSSYSNLFFNKIIIQWLDFWNTVLISALNIFMTPFKGAWDFIKVTSDTKFSNLLIIILNNSSMIYQISFLLMQWIKRIAETDYCRKWSVLWRSLPDPDHLLEFYEVNIAFSRIARRGEKRWLWYYSNRILLPLFKVPSD